MKVFAVRASRNSRSWAAGSRTRDMRAFLGGVYGPLPDRLTARPYATRGLTFNK
ncbi:hypothetical protein SGPA1_12142 [Streptomyces misionensis JCM 4497]